MLERIRIGTVWLADYPLSPAFHMRLYVFVTESRFSDCFGIPFSRSPLHFNRSGNFFNKRFINTKESSVDASEENKATSIQENDIKFPG